MKLNKLWASALALLALASCSKDLEPSANIIEPGEPAKTQLVHMDIKVTQDDNALRVGYGVSNGEDGALTGLAMVEKNVNLRIAVKQGLNGTPEIDTYSFNKVQGANLATFSGSIRIPVKSGNEPYYMAAVLESEGVKNTPDYLEYAKIDSKIPNDVYIQGHTNNKLLQPDAQNKIYPNIPYRSEWTVVTLNSEGTAISTASIKLKPLGTLLRFRIQNTTNVIQSVNRVYFKTPSFTRVGKFDFLETDEQGFPHWFPGYSGEIMDYGFSQKIDLEPTQISNWYYVWFKSYGYTKEVRPEQLLVYYQKVPGGKMIEQPIFKTRKPLSDGSVNVTFKLREVVDAEADDLGEAGDWETADEIYDWPGTVLRRLSTGVVNIAENGFVPVADGNVNVQDASVRYFTFADAVEKFKKPVLLSVNGVNRKYSLPTVSEMRSIFPSSAYPVTSNLVIFDRDRHIGKVLERDVTINGVTQNFEGEYQNVASEKATYAIRFKSPSNKHRTAFKYTLEGDDQNMFVRVKARFWGGNSSLGMSDIRQSSFWSDPSKYDERIFPFYGSASLRSLGFSDHDYGKHGSFWSSSPVTSEFAYVLFCTGVDDDYDHKMARTIVMSSRTPRDLPVFLFERK